MAFLEVTKEIGRYARYLNLPRHLFRHPSSSRIAAATIARMSSVKLAKASLPPRIFNIGLRNAAPYRARRRRMRAR